MNTQNVMFEEFLEGFKIMLVRRYQWTVTRAFEFKDEEDKLKNSYEEGLSIQEAYFQFFNVQPDLQQL